MLDGYRTKIVGWVMALAPAFAMAGLAYDPQAITQFIDNFHGWLAAGYGLGGAAVHYFRNQATK